MHCITSWTFCVCGPLPHYHHFPFWYHLMSLFKTMFIITMTTFYPSLRTDWLLILTALLTTAIIWETLRDLCWAGRQRKSPLCRSVLQLEWAAGRKLCITVRHLKSQLKNYVDLEVLPLLVLGTILKDALIYFQLYCSKELPWQIGTARQEVV